jgi:hypothetical protein
MICKKQIGVRRREGKRSLSANGAHLRETTFALARALAVAPISLPFCEADGDERNGATRSEFEVDCENVSDFTWKYARMFGFPPRRRAAEAG